MEEQKHRWYDDLGRLLCRQLGGIEGPLAARADAILATHYAPTQQDELRYLLLRLVQPGEGVVDIRRRALLDDLAPAGTETESVQLLLKPLVDERLLTMSYDPQTGKQTLEISHEALIYAWPTLSAWIDDAREDLRFHLQLEEAAKEWQIHEKNPDFLWSGLRLANAEEWLARAQPRLNERDQRFLETSRKQEQTRVAAEQARLKQTRTELIMALSSTHHDTRMLAVTELSELADPQTVEALLRTLEQNQPPGLLRRFFSSAEQQRQRAEMRQVIAEALGKIGDSRAVEPLIAQLQDPEPKPRAAAAKALGQIGDKRAVEALTKALSDSEAEVREVAAKALEKIGPPEVEETPSKQEMSPDELLTQATCAVLIGGQLFGTAWLINSEGYILTAGHVLGIKQPINQVEVQFVGDVPRQVQIIEWKYNEEQELDFAILKLTSGINRRPLPISLTREAEGRFRLCGYGTNLSEDAQSSGQGEFSGSMYIRQSASYNLFRLRSSDLEIRGGSGAALFSDEQQAVVGIVTDAAKIRIGPESDTLLAMPLYRIAQSSEQFRYLVSYPKSEMERVLAYQASDLLANNLLVQATCAVLIDNQIVGTAWLVSDEGHLITAGHVLGTEEPIDKVKVQFIEDIPREAHKIQWSYYEKQAIDFAVLKLTTLINRRPLPVSLARTAQGQFRLCGYGTRLKKETQYSGKGELSGSMYIGNSLDSYLFRLHSSDLGSEGNAGGAVFSEELQAVVGIQTEVARARIGPEANTQLAMPLYRVAQLWEPLEMLVSRTTSTSSAVQEPIELVCTGPERHPMTEDMKFCPQCGYPRLEVDSEPETASEPELETRVCSGPERHRIATGMNFCPLCGNPPLVVEPPPPFYTVTLKTAFNKVSVGQRFSLGVELHLVSGPTDDNSFELPSNIAELYCFVTADGLQVGETEVVSIPIDPITGEFAPVTFELQAHLVGKRPYTIELFIEDPESGRIRIFKTSGSVTVIAPEASEPRPLLPTLDVPVAPPPDFVLQVASHQTHDDKRYLTYYLSSRLPDLRLNNEEVGRIVLHSGDLVRLRALLSDRLVEADGVPPEDVREELLSFGTYLFDLLFPRDKTMAFREAFWKVASRVNTLLIIEDDVSWLPWELVVPYEEHDESRLACLGERYQLCRWVEGLGPPRYHEIPFGEVALAHYQLLGKGQEDEELVAWRRLLNASGAYGIAQVVKPETPVYGVHVLLHTDKMMNQREIVLREEEGTPNATSLAEELPQTRLDLRLKRPVMTLSMLNSASSRLLGRVSDEWWLPARVLPFLRAGASAVVAPWWPTAEEADKIFSATFHDLLARRVRLGEAVWRARLAVKRALPQRADWLAYTAFGDPRARPYWPEVSEGYATLECLNANGPLRAGKTYIFRATLRSRPPVWYQERLIAVEKLPERMYALFLAPGLQTSLPEPVEMTPLARTMRQATIELTPPAAGSYPLLVQLLEGEEHLKTIRLTLQVGHSALTEGAKNA